jgi:hypothetical protein
MRRYLVIKLESSKRYRKLLLKVAIGYVCNCLYDELRHYPYHFSNNDLRAIRHGLTFNKECVECQDRILVIE